MTTAIEKIISECARRDYQSQWNKLTRTQKHSVFLGKRYFSYTLSPETNEARQIKIDYESGAITEEEYKAYCLIYNLTHREEI